MLGAFAGCSGDTGKTEQPPETPVVTDAAEAEPEEAAKKVSYVADAYDADLAVVTLNGADVTWSEFFPWVCYAYASHVNSFGDIEDFAAAIGEEDETTYSAYIAGRAVGMLRYYKSIEENCKTLGIELSAEDEALIEDGIVKQREGFDSDEAFEESVKSQYGSMELFRYLLRMTQLSSRCFEAQYGENGDKLSEEDILEYTADDGYLMAKHILVLTQDEEGNALSEEEKTEKYAAAEALLAEIDACKAQEEKIAKFDELVSEKSDDPGSQSFPKGYLFQPGEMVPEFESAVKELENYEYSGIVESSYGYHIIMRLPIDVDSTPMAYSMYAAYGMSYPLRKICAENMFSEVMTGWSLNTPVEAAAGYDTLDLASVFVSE